ncbi:DEAD/DEAH box helicase [Geitlerinema sp. CS-897]|uniref:DEAD/DEAH box helicase n=1 Tax=Baaleninema simplex TaxID=2862350 RepID=UPI000345DB24|nr:DEAD/DEAH box helicase [Baaleninema simplex]MDC0831889.1 DEAD/DEAH box helicase [Geitlerinema sp. CS-897]
MSLRYSLRDYQSILVQQVFKEWTTGRSRRVLLQLPTGAGKTVVFSSIAQQFTDRKQPVLVLAHREELLLQAKDKLERVTDEPVGLIKAGYPEQRSHRVQVASIASLINRKLPPAALVVVDEAHHSTAATYSELLEQFPNAYILGVTATPARIDGRGFKDLYDSLILGPSVRELIDRGYLCSFKLFAAPKTVDTTGIQKTAGDYNTKQLAKAVTNSLVMGDLIAAWQEFADRKKTVVFAVNVEHSQAIADAYRQAGIPAEHLDGNTKDGDRKAVLERFARGETLVLSNCGLFAEGFDLPSIEAVQCVRPTSSLTLWLQIIGRGLRPHPGKDHAILLDHTENWIVHGTPDRIHNWSLDAISLSPGRANVLCSHCRHVFKPRPGDRQPHRYQWHPQLGEYVLICRYTCPHCGEAIELEVTHSGETRPPRTLEKDATAEIWEIPLDCRIEVLAELYRLVGFQRRVRRNITLRWLTNQMVTKCPDIEVSELRECALLLGMDEDWANDWAKQFHRKRDRERTTRS